MSETSQKGGKTWDIVYPGSSLVLRVLWVGYFDFVKLISAEI